MIRLTRMTIAIIVIFVCGTSVAADKKPNILLITVDDMNCDSVGAFGCALANTTPHIDRLAKQGLRFKSAHVQVGNCNPSRNVLLSGRYPHSSGVEGFYDLKKIDYPVMTDLMKRGGYYVAIRGKVNHSTPYQPYAWDEDLTITGGRKLDVKNAQSYYDSTRRGITASRKAGKPFCINVNISDPHKPFYAGPGDRNQPTAVFRPKDVPIPGFLFDHPAVRRELAAYYSSVRRADDCVGKTLKALDDSGQADNTDQDAVFVTDRVRFRMLARRAVLATRDDLRYIYYLVPWRLSDWIERVNDQDALLHPPQAGGADPERLKSFLSRQEHLKDAPEFYVILETNVAPEDLGVLKQIDSENWGEHYRLYRCQVK